MSLRNRNHLVHGNEAVRTSHMTPVSASLRSSRRSTASLRIRRWLQKNRGVVGRPAVAAGSTPSKPRSARSSAFRQRNSTNERNCSPRPTHRGIPPQRRLSRSAPSTKRFMNSPANRQANHSRQLVFTAARSKVVVLTVRRSLRSSPIADHFSVRWLSQRPGATSARLAITSSASVGGQARSTAGAEIASEQ